MWRAGGWLFVKHVWMDHGVNAQGERDAQRAVCPQTDWTDLILMGVDGGVAHRTAEPSHGARLEHNRDFRKRRRVLCVKKGFNMLHRLSHILSLFMVSALGNAEKHMIDDLQ